MTECKNIAFEHILTTIYCINFVWLSLCLSSLAHWATLALTFEHDNEAKKYVVVHHLHQL